MIERPQSRRSHVRLSRGEQDELLAYDVRTDAGHVLNASAAAVYELADGTRNISEIAAGVAERVGLPEDEQVVRLALQELEAADLLEIEAKATTASASGITRRDVIKRLALMAPVAALLPQMVTINRLSQAAAESPRFAGSYQTTGQPFGSYGPYGYY